MSNENEKLKEQVLDMLWKRREKELKEEAERNLSKEKDN